MPSRHKSRFAVLAAGIAIATAAISPDIASAQSIPPMREQGAVRYVCGGIGSDESSAMRAAMKSHPLSLLFSRADGAYLADVTVTVKDAGGATALSARADGPVCLIDLPAGKYVVEAVSGGAARRQDISVGGAPVTADFRF